MDMNHIPDAAMTAAVLALFADGPSTIRNVGSWRLKETDRLAAMATELRKLGAQVEEGTDFLKINPGKLKPGVAIDTYDDHRMAMSFSLVALGGVPVRINDPQCVAKTFPDDFSTFSLDRQLASTRSPGRHAQGRIRNRDVDLCAFSLTTNQVFRWLLQRKVSGLRALRIRSTKGGMDAVALGGVHAVTGKPPAHRVHDLRVHRGKTATRASAMMVFGARPGTSAGDDYALNAPLLEFHEGAATMPSAREPRR